MTLSFESTFPYLLMWSDSFFSGENEYPVEICLWFDLAEQMVTQWQAKRKHPVLLLITVYEVDCC